MHLQQTFPLRVFSTGLFLAAGLGLCSLGLAVPARAMAGDLIPATQAFEAPACSDVQLGGIDVDFGPFGTLTIPSPQRTNPEWKAIILDSSQPPHLQPPTILEGFVSPQANDETSSSQATAEVAEEDLPWTHYTHDFTFKVLPDPAYQHLLSSWVRFPGVFQSPSSVAPDQNGCPAGFSFVPNPDNPDPLAGSCTGCPGGGFLTDNGCQLSPPEVCPDGTTGPTCQHIDMEVEWDSASLMDVRDKEGFQRDWGAVPEFVWPAVGDRVWVAGRWIFDCGHPNTPDGTQTHVKFSTEIHPPRALVTFRLNHPALDSFPLARVSAPNFPGPQSYLPVTGCPVGSFCGPATLPPGVPNSGPTNVPVTEADVFVSVNGGAANDICSIVPVPCSAFGGHTGPIIPVNDRNYVFDIYPPGTHYGSLFGFGSPLVNGTIPVAPPVPGASLQWRVEDHFSELPLHACGGTDNSVCVTVDPIFCLIDSSTPPPDQSETGCPAVPAQPTRLRVILPFAGTNANFFAKSILLGWDDVPTPSNNTRGVRTFQVRLHKLTVNQNGAGAFNDADWRVFVNVGGQWRYMSSIFDTDANNGTGILQFDGGSNVCKGDALTENGEDDCFQFDNTPWTVSVEDGTPIHVAVGGFVARGVEDHTSSLFMCRNFFEGCDAPASFSPLAKPFRAFPFDNDDRIGTYEFDLVGPDYSPPAPFQTTEFGCTVKSLTGCSLQYTVEFSVQEVPRPTPPASAPLVIGLPNFIGSAGIYISAATPMIPQTGDPNAKGFQYRFHRQGGPLPTYAFAPLQPYPVHWAHVDLAPGVHSAEVRVAGANSGDGPYDFQFSAKSFANLLEPRHTATVILDTTPPVATITQPTATQYVHSDSFTVSYSVSDGSGSGVQSATPKMDGKTTLQDGTLVANFLNITLLTELSLGTHTFSVDSVDNVNNAGTQSVTFSVIVTPDSIKMDVTQFLQSGAIKNGGEANSLLAKLDAAAAARARGQCSTAANLYQAFIKELQAQSSKGVDPTAAQIMILDAQYLIAHCP